MSPEEMSLFIWILITLALSAFFSGIEIAFVSADKLQLEIQSKNNTLSGRVISHLTKNPSRFMGTTLVGNTGALVVFGMLFAEFLQPVLVDYIPGLAEREFLFFLAQTVISTLVVLFLAEFLPKSIFLINPDQMIRVFSLPFVIIYWVLYLPVYLIVALSRFTLRKIMRLDYEDDKPVFGRVDLDNFVKSISDSIHKDTRVEVDTKILSNALEFKSIKVRDCMIPRTEISAVDINDGIDELRKEFTRSGHSKILVYRESIDDVIGYCHALELFRKPGDIKEILTPIIIAPETLLANELMIQFINEHKSLALVVDEYGGTSGVVSMEDIIEEIFGEIQDEHDDEELIETKLDPTTWLLSARLEIDYLNEKYHWDLQDGDFETLGGLIFHLVEDIPKTGQKIETGKYWLTVHSMLNNRIGTIKLKLKDG